MGSIDLIQHNLAFTTRTQGCGGVFPGQQTESTRWFKGVLYVGESTPLGEQWTAVAAGSLHLQVSHNPLRSLLTSPWMLSILNFVGSSERATGSAVIGGQRVTEYAGTTTVYAVEQQLASVLHSGAIRRELIELGPLVPQARSVTISIDSWRNDKSQVLEIEATEPLYTGIYSGGGDTENAIQVPTETLSAVGLAPGKPLPPIKDIPKDPLQTLRQQSSFEMTVHFSSYGSAPAIVRPN
jgi:hypothetical protein